MDWNSWVIWTTQGLAWVVIALLIYWFAVRAYFVEKRDHCIDRELINELFDERHTQQQIEQAKQLAYAKGEKA